MVFFPSFSYAEEVQRRWTASGLLAQLATRKRVFSEPRAAGEVEAVLKEYAACITEAAATPIVPTAGGGQQRPATGGVMLCVVGGKLSEGINFGDGLGRCPLSTPRLLSWPFFGPKSF